MDQRVKGCFRYGCFGCLGLILLAVVLGVIFGAIAALQDRTVRVEDQRIEQEIPAVDLSEILEAAPGDPLRDIFRVVPLGEPELARAGRIELDLSIGEFTIEPGPPDQPVRVEATYDTTRFELTQTMKTRDDGRWTYRLVFGAKSMFRLVGVNDGDAPRVRVIIPRDRPFVLDARIRMGESRMELGGLWVLDSRLDYGMGEHSLSFDEPLLAPMKGLDVRGSMGEVRVSGVGNASPETVSAVHGMGSLTVDLRGPWVRDAKATVRCSMGECVVVVPRDVDLHLKTSVTLGERDLRAVRNRPDPPPGAPRLDLRATQMMGEMRIDD